MWKFSFASFYCSTRREERVRALRHVVKQRRLKPDKGSKGCVLTYGNALFYFFTYLFLPPGEPRPLYDNRKELLNG